MSALPGAFACVLVALVVLAIVGTVIEWAIRRRNQKQIAAHRWLGRGMKTAARMGWLPEDLQ